MPAIRSDSFGAPVSLRGVVGCVPRVDGSTPQNWTPTTSSRRRSFDVALWPGSRPLTVVHLNVVHDVDELAGLPLLLTIRQAATVLDVCPAKAYEMAHRYEATGSDGLPVIRLDKLYRVPRWAFAVLVLTGRVVTEAELEAHGQQVRSSSRSARHDPGPGSSRAGGGDVVLAPPAGGLPVVCVRRLVVVALVRSSSCGCSRASRSSCSSSSSVSVRSGFADRCPCGRSGVVSDAAGLDDPCVVGWGVGEVLHPILDRRPRRGAGCLVGRPGRRSRAVGHGRARRPAGRVGGP